MFPVCCFNGFFFCFTSGTALKLLCKNAHPPGLNLNDFNGRLRAQAAMTPAFREELAFGKFNLLSVGLPVICVIHI